MRSFFEWLLKPTYLHAVLLLGVGPLCYWGAPRVDPGLIVVASGAAFAAAVAVFSVLTGQYWDVASLSQLPGLDDAAYARAEEKIRVIIRRQRAYGLLNIVVGCVAGLPFVISLAKVPVPPWFTMQWQAAVVGAAFAFNLMAFLVQLSWQDQLRTFKSKMERKVVEKSEREARLARLRDSRAATRLQRHELSLTTGIGEQKWAGFTGDAESSSSR